MTLLVKTQQTVGEARPTVGVNSDDLQAGYSGKAGGFNSYPATAAMGYLRWEAANNAGDYQVKCVNASFAQACVITLPDPGAATSNFMLYNSVADGGAGAPGGTIKKLAVIIAGVTYYVVASTTVS